MPSLRRLAPVLAIAAFSAALTLPSLAHAQGPNEESDFSPLYEELLLGFDDQAVDTGWIPNGSPVQMRFYAAASNSIMFYLPGMAHYDWRTEELSFVGDPEAGLFEYDIGLQLEATVKVDIANVVQWDSDLLGPYDWGVQAVDMFTPYLLEGNPDRPAMIEDKSGMLDLVSIPLIPDILILSGNLDIALFVDVTGTLVCNRVEVIDGMGETVVFTQEGESRFVEPGDGPDEVVFGATAFCQLTTQPTLIIYPHLVMEVLFDEYDIGGIEIPIDLPVVDDEIQLETLDLVFPYWEEPPPPEPPEGDGDGDPATGDESGEDTGDTGETGETGDELGASGLGDEGCNCSNTSIDPRGGAWTLFGLFALLGLRRRRGDDA